MDVIPCGGRSCCWQRKTRTRWRKPSGNSPNLPRGGRSSPKPISRSRRNNVASLMKEDVMQTRRLPFRFIMYCIVGLAGLWILPVLASRAEESSDKGAIVEGAGFTLYDMESIKGFDEKKIEGDPICDRSKRPKIHKVEPDEAKPGQKVTIKGENFGTKECFHGVAFSAAGPAKIDYKFVSDTTIEATVPDVKAGMSFIDVVAGGGNARSKGFLVQAK